MGIFDWFTTKENTETQRVEIQRDVDFSDFNTVTDFIYQKSGITDLEKRGFTSSKLQKFALESGVYTSKEFLEKMQFSELFLQDVLNITTVNETFFYREEKELDWLVKYIKQSKKRVEILSMPCSSGEEIYSIILLMQREKIELNRVRFHGYDINSQAVEKAKKALYEEHSLHKVTLREREKYFVQKSQGKYEIRDDLKKNILFLQKNIFDIKEKNCFDIVLSRNMFIYFDDKKRELALNIIVALLRDGGIYIKGHADQIKEHKSLKNIHYGIYSKQI